jgi:cytoskeletal protein RodZ
MSQTLGEKLRAAREERGISISEVAEQTRISPHYLESIENDDYKTLPGGIFNKGFVKSYGKYVGLDENEVMQDYAALNVGAAVEEEGGPVTYRPEVLTDDRNTSTMLPTLVFAIIILALMSGGILFLVNYLRNRESTPSATVSPTPAANAAAANPAQAQLPPPTDTMNIEVRAVGEPVWISYVIDGAAKIQTLSAGESLKVTPKDSFKVSYSKAKLPNLQVIVNDKQLTAPPASAKGTIEIDINKSNLQQVLQGSQAAANPQPTTEQPVATTPRPVRPRPTANATPKTAANTTAKPTPIIVGRPRAVPSPEKE